MNLKVSRGKLADLWRKNPDEAYYKNIQSTLLYHVSAYEIDSNAAGFYHCISSQFCN